MKRLRIEAKSGASFQRVFIGEEINTKNIFERIDTMMAFSDGFIALQGGTGTLLELAAILEHINKGMMQPKPVIAVGRYWKGVVDSISGEDVLDENARSRFKIKKCSELVVFAKDVDEAVKEMLSRI